MLTRGVQVTRRPRQWWVVAWLVVLSVGGCIRYDVPEQPDLTHLVAAYAHPSGVVDEEAVHEAAGGSRLAERVAWAVFGLDVPGAMDQALEGLDPLLDPSEASTGGDGAGESLTVAGMTLGGSGSVRVTHGCDEIAGRDPGGMQAVLSLRQTSIEPVASGEFLGCEASTRLFAAEDEESEPPISVRLDGGFAVDLGGPLALGDRLDGRWMTFRFDGRVELAGELAVEEPMDFQTGPSMVAIRIAHPGGGHVLKVLSGGVPGFTLVGAGGAYECQLETRSCNGPLGTFSW